MAESLDSLIIHPVSREQLDRILAAKPQGILLAGESGTGLFTIAEALARKLFTEKTITQVVQPDEKGTIGIGIIQNLYHTLRTKQADKVIVIIDDADKMTLDAQNALLKLLEEPPAYLSFILTTHANDGLLPTILSRVQTISFRNVAHSACIELLPNDLDSKTKAQIVFLGDGYPAEIQRLVSAPEYFRSRAALMSQAREFLTASTFDRLAFLSTSGFNRDAADEFIRMLCRILIFSIDKQSKASLIDSMEELEKALLAVRQNGNVRLQMSNLSLRLGKI